VCQTEKLPNLNHRLIAAKNGGIATKMKIYLLCFTAGLMAATSSVHAATKCVKLTPSANCSYNQAVALGQSNWTFSCNKIQINGVMFCGSQKSNRIGSISDTVQISTTSENNRYCWCKIVTPAVSPWVFVQDRESAYNCAQSCARSCATFAAASTDFQSILFSNLGD